LVPTVCGSNLLTLILTKMLRSAVRVLKTPAAKAFVPARFASSSKPIAASNANLNLGTTDDYFETMKIKKDFGERNNRDFFYFVNGLGRMTYATTIRVALIRMVSALAPTADVLALASAEFEIDSIAEGTTLTVKWRGKPVFVKHRTADEIASVNSVDISTLPDPQTDADRVSDPEWLIVLGVCTHLGCVPISNAGDYGGWFCPCHGSHYDASGRIRKGPAPLNLEVPPYTLNSGKLVVG